VSYAAFKHNPCHANWPRRCGDLVGRAVEAAMILETRGGNVFPAGTKFKVQGVYRGRLHLVSVNGEFIRGVRPGELKLIPAGGS